MEYTKIYTIEDVRYEFVDEIEYQEYKFVFLAAENDESNLIIVKEYPNNDIFKLDREDEVKVAMTLFYEKHKNLMEEQ